MNRRSFLSTLVLPVLLPLQQQSAGGPIGMILPCQFKFYRDKGIPYNSYTRGNADIVHVREYRADGTMIRQYQYTSELRRRQMPAYSDYETDAEKAITEWFS